MPDDPTSLSESIRALGRFLVGHKTLGELLDQVEELGRQATGADMAGITLLDENGRATTAVFTDKAAPEIDVAQYETGNGPCLDAFRQSKPFVIENTRDDDRWPEFARAAADKGVVSTMSLPMVSEGRAVGALNLYSRRLSAFGDEDVNFAMTFAEHAGIAVANSQAYWGAFKLSEQLSEAMASRATIEQAKGILMASHGCDADRAFQLLREQSQRSNRKLREIAAEIVAAASKAKDSASGL